MVRRFSALVVLVAAIFWHPAPAGASARTRYERVAAQAAALRLDGPRPSPLSQMRRVRVACEAVARRYPSSGYADNALWEAAQLALAAHRVYGSTIDRDDGVRLLVWLVREYPSSSLRRRARALLEEVGGAVPPKAAPAPAPTVAPTAAPAAAPAASPEPPVITTTLKRVQHTVMGDILRVTAEFDREVEYRQDELAGPRRIYFDFPGTETIPRLQDAAFTVEGPAVRQIRLGRPRPHTTRMVIDLDGAQSYSVFTLYNPFRLAVDIRFEKDRAVLLGRRATPAAAPGIAGPGPKPIATILAAEQARLTARLTPRPLPYPLADRAVRTAAAPAPRPVAAAMQPPLLTVRTLRLGRATATAPRAPRARAVAPQIVAAIAEATRRPELPAKRPATPSTAPAPALPVENGAGGFSLARQLGLGVSRIVIDPGHGGKDPGAMNGRTSEADIVLDVALRLERLLRAEPGFDVVLTRRTDVYVPLEERTAFANRAGADLFLSIHANSSRNRRAAGVETYFLNFASNPEAEAVAARENATAQRSMNQLPEIVRAIALNNKLDESRDFARMVQDAMVSRLKRHNGDLRDLGVKQAPFVVLIGAGMPSVLAEIAFISHESEGSLLRTPAYRQRVAEALFEAVTQYKRTLKSEGTVASQ